MNRNDHVHKTSPSHCIFYLPKCNLFFLEINKKKIPKISTLYFIFLLNCSESVYENNAFRKLALCDVTDGLPQPTITAALFWLESGI